MIKISGIIITLNEEINIERCIKTIIPFCDEIILVDSFSTDKTVEIAQKFTSNIHLRKPDTIINQINFATSLVHYDWVFCIDADERVTNDLCNMILQIKSQNHQFDAYSINRLNYYVNDFFKYCGWYPDRKIRLFNKTKGVWGGIEPHYQVVMQPNAKVMQIKHDLIHFTYKNISHQIEKMNRFSSQAANQMSGDKHRFLLLKMVIHPLSRFVKCYFFQKGILGGVKGLANAVIASFYVFCKYLKIWEALHAKDSAIIDKKMF